MKDNSINNVFTGWLARWTLFSCFGLAAGIALALSVADPVEKLVGMMLVTPVVLFVAGIVLGGSQWLAIWRLHRKGFAWIVATGIAVGIGMTLGIVVVEIVGRAITGTQMRLFGGSAITRTISLLVIGLFTGLSVGVSQWVVMRQQLRGSNWILLTTLAFTIGFPSGALAAGLVPGGLLNIMGFGLFVSITGFIVGVVTALPARRIERSLSARLTSLD
ncbi:MAG: hypothetical protein ABL888_06330 [Pirellulaceae bacterium]